MKSCATAFEFVLPILLLSTYLGCKSAVGDITEKSQLFRNNGNEINWRQDCGSASLPGLLKLSGCESVKNCNLNIGSNYRLWYEWMPAQPYDRLDYFISAVKIFPHEQFMFVHGSDGPYESESVFVQQEIFHINETFQATGQGWSILFVKEINGIMDVCNVFEVTFVKPFLNNSTTTITTTTTPTTSIEPVISQGPEISQVKSCMNDAKKTGFVKPELTIMQIQSPTKPLGTSNLTATEPPETVSSTAVAIGGPFICSEEDLFPDSPSGSSFHYCLLDAYTGLFNDVILRCPGGLVFCGETKMCDHKEACPS